MGGGCFYGDLSVTAAVPWFGSARDGDKDLEGFDVDYLNTTALPPGRARSLSLADSA
jgi:acetone carboxylase gamma subunit